jgi:hypothetical protein
MGDTSFGRSDRAACLRNAGYGGKGKRFFSPRRGWLEKAILFRLSARRFLKKLSGIRVDGFAVTQEENSIL